MVRISASDHLSSNVLTSSHDFRLSFAMTVLIRFARKLKWVSSLSKSHIHLKDAGARSVLPGQGSNADYNSSSDILTLDLSVQ